MRTLLRGQYLKELKPPLSVRSGRQTRRPPYIKFLMVVSLKWASSSVQYSIVQQLFCVRSAPLYIWKPNVDN